MTAARETPSRFPQPLRGKLVLDLSFLFPGPYCTAQLAAFGARVIKVEPPDSGDPMRTFSPAMFEQINRNKQSIAVNLKHADGQTLLKRMAARAHALVEGYRPGVMQRLGVGYEALKQANPGLIYCAISGFGQDGPYRDRAGHDLGLLALGGYYSVPSQIAPLKSRPNVRLADAVAGQVAAYAISMAVWNAQQSGQGCMVDASIFDSVASLALPLIFSSSGLDSGDVRQMDHVMADSDLYETLDGRHLALTTFEDKFWHGFAAAVRDIAPALAAERFATRVGRNAHKVELGAALVQLFRTRTLAQWKELLDAADTAYAPVYEGNELLADPHFRARALAAGIDGRNETEDPRRYWLFPAKFDGMREVVQHDAPALGADTDAVLRVLGYSESESDALRRQGTVA